MKLLNGLLELLFPRKCVFCCKLLAKGEIDCCAACRKIETYQGNCKKLPYVAGWTAVYTYEDNVREALLRYKFRGKEHYAPTFGKEMAAAIRETFPSEFDLITYVPISKKRLRKRGYDQDKLLAEVISKELNAPMIAALKKVKNNPAQSSIQKVEARHANVMGVYRATALREIAGKRILLIDDILTTCANVSECARVLLTAGAAEVRCTCFATRREK